MRCIELLVVLLLCALQCVPSSLAASSQQQQAATPKGGGPVHFDIPPEFTVSRKNMHKIDVVSSHGISNTDSSAAAATAASPLQLALRLVYLCFIFSPVVLTSPLAIISTVFRSHVWFWILSQSIAISGAAFIKWGQWASTRPDIFPPELCTALAELQANAPEHSYAFTRLQIEKELGRPLESVFQAFSQKPIASGSIAQVYKARLNGMDVAVKVRHPHVREHIEMDFVLMKALAAWVESLPGMGWLTLSDSMAQFSVTIASQVALDTEGKHLYIFNRNFRRNKEVRFPRTVFFTDSVLVETFEKGESVAKYIEVVKAGRKEIGREREREREKELGKGRGEEQGSRQEALIPNIHNGGTAREIEYLSHFIVTKGEDAYLKMLLTDNLMHADLHPGNILVQSPAMGTDSGTGAAGSGRGGKRSSSGSSGGGFGLGVSADDSNNNRNNNNGLGGPYRIVMVDAGMVARLTAAEQRNFIGLLTAMGDGDGRAAARFIMRFSHSSPASNAGQAGKSGETELPKANRGFYYSLETQRAFEADMVTLFAEVCRGYGRNTDIGQSLRGILNLCRVHRISIDANYATLVMNALCLDGMAKLLLPNYNVLDGAESLLRANKWLSRVPLGLGGGLRKLLLPLAYALKSRHDARFCC